MCPVELPTLLLSFLLLNPSRLDIPAIASGHMRDPDCALLGRPCKSGCAFECSFHPWDRMSHQRTPTWAAEFSPGVPIFPFTKGDSWQAAGAGGGVPNPVPVSCGVRTWYTVFLKHPSLSSPFPSLRKGTGWNGALQRKSGFLSRFQGGKLVAKLNPFGTGLPSECGRQP